MAEHRTKVLQVITGLGNGGAERLVLDLIREMDQKKFDVRLASITPDLSALKTYGHQDRSVEVFDLSGSGRINSLMKMRRFMRDFAPDVVHAHMFHAFVASVLSRAPQLKAPAICFTSHNFDQAFPPVRAAIVKLLSPLRAADILFSETQHPILNCRNTNIIGNGVPVCDTLAPRRSWRDAATIRLIAVGRISEQKDPLGMIRTLAKLNDPRVRMDFFGQGPLEQECEKLIRKLGLEQRVRLRGLSNQIRNEMRNADILVMHSLYEGMPMVLLEAGAEAMPVISTPVGSIPNLLGDDRGVLAPAAGFADQLSALIADPEKAIENGMRFHHYVNNNHTISASARLHEKLYVSLTNERLR